MATTEYTVVYEPDNPRYLLQGREKKYYSDKFTNIEGFHMLENAIRLCDEYTLINPEYSYRVVKNV